MYNLSDSQYLYWNFDVRWNIAPNFLYYLWEKPKQVGYRDLQSCFSPAAATQLIILLDVMQQINSVCRSVSDRLAAGSFLVPLNIWRK